MYPEHLKIDSLQSLYVKNRLKSIFLYSHDPNLPHKKTQLSDSQN